MRTDFLWQPAHCLQGRMQQGRVKLQGITLFSRITLRQVLLKSLLFFAASRWLYKVKSNVGHGNFLLEKDKNNLFY